MIVGGTSSENAEFVHRNGLRGLVRARLSPSAWATSACDTTMDFLQVMRRLSVSQVASVRAKMLWRSAAGRRVRRWRASTLRDVVEDRR